MGRSSVDASLIRRGAAGDQAALTELYEWTYGSVLGSVRTLIRDEDTALDIVQDSYLKAFAGLDQLKDPSRFEAWIRQIARNRALDVLRQKRLISFSELEVGGDPPLSDIADDRPEHLPEVVIEQKETARLINEILDALPADQRAVISLFYYDQLSIREIAEELKVSENTVKSRLNYGRKKVETQVRALEKKGTKLYGLAPLPFLCLLLRNQALSLGPASAAKTAGQSAAAAGRTAAAAGKAAGHALRTKILIGAALAGTAVGGSAAYIRFSQPPAEPSRVIGTARNEQILPDSFLRDMERLASLRLDSLLSDHETLDLVYTGGTVSLPVQYLSFTDLERLREAVFTETGGVTSFYLLYKGDLEISPDWPGRQGPFRVPDRITDAVAVFSLDTFPVKFRLPDGSLRYDDKDLIFSRFYESEDAFYAAVREDLRYVSHDYYELILP